MNRKWLLALLIAIVPIAQFGSDSFDKRITEKGLLYQLEKDTVSFAETEVLVLTTSIQMHSAVANFCMQSEKQNECQEIRQILETEKGKKEKAEQGLQGKKEQFNIIEKQFRSAISLKKWLQWIVNGIFYISVYGALLIAISDRRKAED
ncbi:MAG: hypothetical protein HYT41_00200 [Candidatus Sungbacteria bacterium]|nr:hypothetical protein [Candidatus Sungbacteria bacterium]